MSRSLLALAAIAAASVVGVWIQAATDGAARVAPRQTTLTEAAKPIPAAVVMSPTASAPGSKSLPKSVAATGGTQAPMASSVAVPEPLAPSNPGPRLGAAMRIAADPITGQIVTPEHTGRALTLQEMQELARAEAVGLVTIREADGSETLNHEGRFTDFSVLRVDASGKLVYQCVHGETVVEHTLHHAAPVTPKMEDR